MTTCPRCHPDSRPTTIIPDLCGPCRAHVEQQPAIIWRRESALPAKGD